MFTNTNTSVSTNYFFFQAFKTKVLCRIFCLGFVLLFHPKKKFLSKLKYLQINEQSEENNHKNESDKGNRMKSSSLSRFRSGFISHVELPEKRKMAVKNWRENNMAKQLLKFWCMAFICINIKLDKCALKSYRYEACFNRDWLHKF